ncbi:hypothetical protein PIB30_030227 [Stylosanthes scabra]|uniref:Uncharacterized protein n=1 Tax=Stylosanthes scabra TaxID=79078 RepID=A0ABU6VD54_9FABA|nr:hypothetical protein [Stylosanthes scabra]
MVRKDQCLPLNGVQQKPKEHGGLGVGDLAMKNATLLFKWWDKSIPFTKTYGSSPYPACHFSILFHTIDRHRLIPIFKKEIDDPKFFDSIHKVFSARRLVGGEKGPYSVPHSVLHTIGLYSDEGELLWKQVMGSCYDVESNTNMGSILLICPRVCGGIL